MELKYKVEGCKNSAVVREVYLKPGGEGKFEDPVCSWHTGRNPRLQMVGRLPVPGTVEYKPVEEG